MSGKGEEIADLLVGRNLGRQSEQGPFDKRKAGSHDKGTVRNANRNRERQEKSV